MHRGCGCNAPLNINMSFDGNEESAAHSGDFNPEKEEGLKIWVHPRTGPVALREEKNSFL